MRRLDSATADRWLATVLPSWLRRDTLLLLWAIGLVAWIDADAASWVVLVATLCAVLVELGAPRAGWLLGIGSGASALVLEREVLVGVIWLCFGFTCLVLLIWYEVSRRRQRALGLGDNLSIRIAFDDEERLAVFTDDDQERLVAFVEVDHPLALEDALAAVPEDDDDLREQVTAAHLRPYAGRATLIGELVEGTRPRFVTPAGTLEASSRLRARRRGETFDPLPDVAAPDLPETSPQDVPDLPWVPKQVNEFDRWGLVRFAAAGFSAVWIGYDWFTTEDLKLIEDIVAMAFVLGIPIALDQLCRKVVVDRDCLRIRGPVVDRTIPWSRVKEISRRTGGEIVIDLGSRTRKLRFDGEDGRPTSGRVADVLETMRARSSGLAHAESVRLSWGVYVLAAYVVGLAAGAYYVLPRLF